MSIGHLRSVTVGLAVADLAAAQAWYAGLLGREPDLKPAPGVVEFRLTQGCWLQLVERPGAGHGKDTAHSAVVRFGVSDLDQVRSRLTEQGVDTGPVQTVPGAVRYCDLLDPFGNVLSVYEVLEQPSG